MNDDIARLVTKRGLAQFAREGKDVGRVARRRGGASRASGENAIRDLMRRRGTLQRRHCDPLRRACGIGALAAGNTS